MESPRASLGHHYRIPLRTGAQRHGFFLLIIIRVALLNVAQRRVYVYRDRLKKNNILISRISCKFAEVALLARDDRIASVKVFDAMLKRFISVTFGRLIDD